jgi:hypothetical protein
MRKIYMLAFIFAFLFVAKSQNAVCDSTGNFIVYSNYDGGTLRLSVDVNIPNLQIGIVSYEDDSVVIGGPYASNVTKVVYAGYYNSSNVHCTPNISMKGVYGVSSNIVSINFMPVATLSNPNGDGNIICNYSCNASTNQGGCNTPDQIVDYFYNQFPGSKMYYHYTQYGCWSGSYLVSGGGNCCIVPITTGMEGVTQMVTNLFFPNPAQNELNVRITPSEQEQSVQLFTLSGYLVKEIQLQGGVTTGKIALEGLSSGVYIAVLKNGTSKKVQRIVIQ